MSWVPHTQPWSSITTHLLVVGSQLPAPSTVHLLPLNLGDGRERRRVVDGWGRLWAHSPRPPQPGGPGRGSPAPAPWRALHSSSPTCPVGGPGQEDVGVLQNVLLPHLLASSCTSRLYFSITLKQTVHQQNHLWSITPFLPILPFCLFRRGQKRRTLTRHGMTWDLVACWVGMRHIGKWGN